MSEPNLTKAPERRRPSDVLRSMLLLFGPDGAAWCKGAFKKKATLKGDTDKFCLLGACQELVPNSYQDQEQVNFYVRKALRETGQMGPSDIVGFNDEYRRTFPEVAAVVTKAAELAEAEGQ